MADKKGTGRRPKDIGTGVSWRKGQRRKGYFGPRLCPTCMTKRWFRSLDGSSNDDSVIECMSCYTRGTLGGLCRAINRRRTRALAKEDHSLVHKAVSKESFKARMKRVYGKTVEVD